MSATHDFRATALTIGGGIDFDRQQRRARRLRAAMFGHWWQRFRRRVGAARSAAQAGPVTQAVTNPVTGSPCGCH